MKKILFILLMSFIVGFKQTTNSVIQLSPSQNIIPIINNADENTIFNFAEGTYYVGKLKPKAGQQFIGEGKVILSGSRKLSTNTWTQQGNYWVANVTTNKNAIRDVSLCLDKTSRCHWPEDLYVDNKFLVHKNALTLVDQNSWFLERTESMEKIWIAFNPNGKTIEISVEPRLFTTAVNGLILENLTIEKYASPLQMAALELKGTSYYINKVIFQLNHAAGLEIWNKSIVENSEFLDNGQKGLGGGGTDLIVRWNNVHHNNVLNVDPNWDAGGSKFANTTNLLIFQNEFHDNNGHGIWCDVRNVNCVIDNNIVYNEYRNGIFCEWGVSCIVKNNTLTNNGWRSGDRLGDASITILDNNNSQVFGNTVYVYEKGNAISVYEDERGQDFPVEFAIVRDNEIHFLNERGTIGYGSQLGEVVFANNSYFSDNLAYSHFYIDSVKTTFNVFKNAQENEGEIRPIQEPVTLTPTNTFEPTRTVFVTNTNTPSFTVTPTPTSLVRKFKIIIEGIITIEEIE